MVIVVDVAVVVVVGVVVLVEIGARCSSVVRALAHGAMGRRIDPSWGEPVELLSRSSQCSTTGLTKAVVCAILSVWEGAYKRTLAANRKE